MSDLGAGATFMGATGLVSGEGVVGSVGTTLTRPPLLGATGLFGGGATGAVGTTGVVDVGSGVMFPFLSPFGFRPFWPFTGVEGLITGAGAGTTAVGGAGGGTTILLPFLLPFPGGTVVGLRLDFTRGGRGVGRGAVGTI